MQWQRLWPTLIPIGAGIITALTPTIQAWIARHPEFAMLWAAITAAIANLAPSPARGDK